MNIKGLCPAPSKLDSTCGECSPMIVNEGSFQGIMRNTYHIIVFDRNFEGKGIATNILVHRVSRGQV